MAPCAAANSIVIALLGAESTGKSTLAQQLLQKLTALNLRVALVPEYLRQWCIEHERVPYLHEQSAIAKEQTRRIEQAQRSADIVIADTTALQTAVYSDYIFADCSLYAYALVQHERYPITLLMGIDLPWVADGFLRDGSQVRFAIDALLRKALQRSDSTMSVIYGQGEARLHAALAVITAARLG